MLAALALVLLAADEEAPSVEHAPPAGAVLARDLELRARFKDASEIFAPTLYYRPRGESRYRAVAMQRKDDAYAAIVPGRALYTDLEYYVEVYDEFGNGPARSGQPESPHRVDVDEPPQAPTPAAHPPPPPDDAFAPAITHTPPAGAFVGEPITVRAKIVDASPLLQAMLHFRRGGAPDYVAVPLVKEGGVYVAEVPTFMVNGPVEYFLEAYDTWGNGPAQHGTPAMPHRLEPAVRAVAPEPATAPPSPPPKPEPPSHLWTWIAGGLAVAAAGSAVALAVDAQRYRDWHAQILAVSNVEDQDPVLLAAVASRAQTETLVAGISAGLAAAAGAATAGIYFYVEDARAKGTGGGIVVRF